MVRFFATSLCSFLVLLPALASAQLPNLMGSVALPTQGQPGQSIPITIQVRNGAEVSNAPGTFYVQVWLSEQADLFAQGNVPELIFDQPITLDGTNCAVDANGIPAGCRWPKSEGGNQATQITVKLEDTLEQNAVYAVLIIDPFDDVLESNENDNVFVSPRQMELLRPNVQLKRSDIAPPRVEFEHGTCYFGEGATITYEVYNDGAVDAWAFLDEFILSEDKDVQKLQGSTDIVFDSIPKQCSGDDSSVCGENAFCGHGVCKTYCSTAADCPANFVCEPDKESAWFVGKTCQLFQAAKAPFTTHTREITLPTRDNKGALIQEREYYILVANVPSPFYPERTNDKHDNNSWGQDEPFFCQHPRPDFEINDLVIPTRVAAGETATIVRKLTNRGIRDGETTYQYVLSHNEYPTKHDLVLPIESGARGEVAMEKQTVSETADLVRIPSFVKPGTYHIGILVDPDDQVSELDESNNVMISTQLVQVEPPSLAVVTRSLADATLGLEFTADLVAVGGVAAHVWSAEVLPPGMELSEEGTLTGKPREPGRFSFPVTVRSGDVAVTETLVLRVFPPMGPLSITTQRLPPAVAQQSYAARIDAQGGMPAYTCSLFQSGTGETGLPTGIILNEDCTIAGRASSTGVGDYNFGVRVVDQLGNAVTGIFTLKVVEASNLRIDTQRLNQATAGKRYGDQEHDCIIALGGDGQYIWEVEATPDRRMPDGLSTRIQPDRNHAPSLCLAGEPTECGEFLIPVRVTDGNGQSDFADVPLAVLCADAKLLTHSIEPVRVGDEVDATIEFEAGEGGKVRILTGALPPGLTLAEDGTLSGKVDENAQPGTYSVQLLITDKVAGHEVDAFTIVVLPNLPELPFREDIVEKEGCSSAGGGLGGLLPWAVALLGLFALGLRRRPVTVEARIPADRS